MKAYKMNVFLPVVAFSILTVMDCAAQADRRPITKFGGWYYYGSEAPNYALCLERERSFGHSLAFTHGPRLDYHYAKASPTYAGSRSMIISYQFKYYPFARLRGKQARGLFVGVNPCYFLKVGDQYVYGPGIGGLLGYQLWIFKKITASVELSFPYMQNVNSTPGVGVPNAWYLHGFFFAKIGMRVGSKKNE